jgi:hypothetical protein
VRVGDTVSCHVTAERPGADLQTLWNYGMLLAEIGLPPGVDVDRQSLEDARMESGYALNHYDILPDRILCYVWPHTGAVNFSFRFRPRMAMRAKTAPSLLYDYYNPAARAEVAPVEFRVSPK